MTSKPIRQEWIVALAILAVAAVAFALGLFLVRNVDTDLGLTPVTTEDRS